MLSPTFVPCRHAFGISQGLHGILPLHELPVQYPLDVSDAVPCFLHMSGRRETIPDQNQNRDRVNIMNATSESHSELCDQTRNYSFLHCDMFIAGYDSKTSKLMQKKLTTIYVQCFQ